MPHPTRQVIIRWAAAVLLALAMYPLSFGPYAYLWVRSEFRDADPEDSWSISINEIGGTVFAPCVSLYSTSSFYESYVDWWIDKAWK